jgi:drug/metabolite transporter (DMT)-like permease
MEVKMLAHLLLIAVLALSVYSQLMVKARALVHTAGPGGASEKMQYLLAMFTDPRVLIAGCATVLAGICWVLVIGRLQIGYALPFLALNFVLVPVGSTVLFGEPLPGIQLLGLGLIMVGVTVSALAR